MLEQTRLLYSSLLQGYPWAQELAGLLPLSALIDFLDVPRVLHAFELSGVIPLWCWPVTPSGSRLLLSEQGSDGTCCLDRFGRSPSLTCLDGRYGDMYPMASPETVRLCRKGIRSTRVLNDHDNMKQDSKRIQNLELIVLSRTKVGGQTQGTQWIFTAASAVGWVIFLGFIVFGCLMRSWIMVSFYSIVLLTGMIIFLLHGGKPRRLRVEHGSDYNRLVVVAEHMNETNWQVYYGESSLVNSMLNWTLRPSHPARNHYLTLVLRGALRICILGQWGLALGAAASKGWDAYFITFWVVFCIFSHSSVFSAESSAKSWLTQSAEVRMERFKTQLSSRRALLNTVMALNPDTFEMDEFTRRDITERLFAGALLWIDPILRAGPSRTQWEEASRLAMVEAKCNELDRDLSEKTSMSSEVQDDWMTTYGQQYWCRFISEGIEVAAKLAEQASLTGRFVKYRVGPS
ncbi:hypothetical protein F5B20DRAFT_259428 [Whalleya microplaca]|nr:hypothetical protein F5B20DRAFT_259428 [Whalleya microplaca]